MQFLIAFITAFLIALFLGFSWGFSMKFDNKAEWFDLRCGPRSDEQLEVWWKEFIEMKRRRQFNPNYMQSRWRINSATGSMKAPRETLLLSRPKRRHRELDRYPKTSRKNTE